MDQAVECPQLNLSVGRLCRESAICEVTGVDPSWNMEARMKPNDSALTLLRSEEGQRFDVGGSAMLYKLTSENTGGAYSFAIEVAAPQAGFPLHVHRLEDEAMYLLEGELEVQCGDRVFRVGPGDLVFLPRGVPNRYVNCGSEPAKFVYITSPGGFERLVGETSKIMASGAPDPEKLHAAAQRHQIEFL